MSRSTRDRLVDDLLEGRADATGTANARVDAFLGELRATVRDEPMPPPTGALATLLRDGRNPIEAVTPLASAHRSRHIGRRARIGTLVATGATVMSATMAAAGVLPSPIQHTAANLATKFGIELPGAARHHRAPTRPTPTQPAAPHTSQSTTTATAAAPPPAPATNPRPTTKTTPTTRPATTPSVPALPTVPVLPTLPTVPTLPTRPILPIP